ncbi:hypothetical protein M378DRAFT_18778 [Amanita muscaria Koide BX008]|uniref:Uncharacterized protein n=1 Tax=Amanita muscaria (strain Koide BX008) TaxID=946122 RepID=A0A0C2WDB4_AMAMK|nr:hypothetical protein M378DRAFT_18778 [Amanita muscaria Koide BX008]
MNLCQRGLLRAQTNALKVIVPELDPEPPLTRGAQPIGDGYVLLTAHDEEERLVRDVMQINALINFFTQHGKPERISDGKFSLERWARLCLPNGQIARCAWKEIENGLTRNSRNVKFRDDGSTHFGEVLYYFQTKIVNEEKEPLGTYAMVSVYGKADANLLSKSSHTLRIIHYKGSEDLRIIKAKSITSVVALFPFILSDDEKKNPNICAQYLQSFFVGEKPFLDFTTNTTDPSQEDIEEAGASAE